MSSKLAPPPVRDREEVQALAGLIVWFAVTAAWWTLALWPVDAGPVWLERTRYVCFGVGANGLPDGGGWIGLIGGPLGMLAILLVGWNGGMRMLLLRGRRSRAMATMLGALALGCVAIAAGAIVRVQQARASTWTQAESELPASSYPVLDRPAPRLSLTAQHGAVIDLVHLTGRPVLVTFAYAHCQTVCPLVVMNVLRARAALEGTADAPHVLIVTLDPWRDPPSRLAAMARSWGIAAGDGWVLSGSVAEVESTLDAWEVPRQRDTQTGEVTHPSLVYVIDRAGRIAYASTGATETLVALIRRL